MTKCATCSNKDLFTDLPEMAKFLRVIGEDNRLKILCILKNGELCVSEIEKFLHLPQNLVSNHLKALRDFGLVEKRQEWKNIYYYINKKAIKNYNLMLKLYLKNYE